MSFLEITRRSIEEELARSGLSLRSPTLEDMPILNELQRAAFPEYRPEQLMNDQFFYRLIEYGSSVLLHDGAGQIRGYHLVFHLNHVDRVALSCGMVVHASLKGKNIGALIYRHAAVRSMAAGARLLQGTVKTTNLPSLAVLLNKVGAVCDRFHPRLGVWRDHRFRHTLGLSESSLGRPSIDFGRLVEFAHRSIPGVDYQLVAADDFAGLESMYRETEMRIVAVAPPGLLDEGTMLFALPLWAAERIRAVLGGGA